MKLVRIAARFGVFFSLVGLLALAVYWIGSRLSSDAIGLIIGLLFGMLASLPGALLALSARRNVREAHSDAEARYPAPGPVIVVVEGGKAQLLDHSEAAIVPYVEGVREA